MNKTVQKKECSLFEVAAEEESGRSPTSGASVQGAPGEARPIGGVHNVDCREISKLEESGRSPTSGASAQGAPGEARPIGGVHNVDCREISNITCSRGGW